MNVTAHVHSWAADAMITLSNAGVMFTGGALGWKKRGDLELPFETVAFELEASTTANPKYGEAKTGHGYHIIMVEGRK